MSASKLKTLRDIELYHKINTDVKDDYDVLYIELKEAAREWLKEFQEKDRQAIQEIGGSIHQTACFFIDYFFNLGEYGDKKEEKK